MAVQLATVALHRSCGVASAHAVQLSVARERPSLFVEDFQFVAMIVCLASVSIASKLESQVPFMHLTNLLQDYLQRPAAVAPVKAFVVRTEGEILQLVGWDALQPAQLSLAVMEQVLGALHSEHPQHADAIIHFINRVDDSLMNFVARHRNGGTTACLEAWQQLQHLQRLRTMSVEEFMFQDAGATMSADEARIQIVVNSPCAIFPLVAVKAAAHLLRMEHADDGHVLKFMGMELSEELCLFFGHLLDDIATRAANDLLQNYQQSAHLLPDYVYAMMEQQLTPAALTKFVTRCIQASERFLVARLRLVCGPQSRKSPVDAMALLKQAELLQHQQQRKPRAVCVSPPHMFAPPAVAVSPPSSHLAAIQAAAPQMAVHQLPPMPQPQLLSFAGQKMHRDEQDYDGQPSCKRFCGPSAAYAAAAQQPIPAYTPAQPVSPTAITASFSGSDSKVADYGPVYPSMCGVMFNDLSFGGQAVAVKAEPLFHDLTAAAAAPPALAVPVPQPSFAVHTTSVGAPLGIAEAGFQQLSFQTHHHHQSFFMVQGPTPQYIFT